MLISNNDQLADCIAKLKDDKFISIDTEFMRDKYYYPRLALIQIAGKNTAFAIDGLADINLDLLKPLLSKKSLVKVFHSCQQDLEVFYNYFGFIPSNIFDTQIALLFLGYKEQPSYETLIKDFLHRQLDKKLQFSDWLKRPLSDKHLKYAVDDVLFLQEVYPIILEKIEALNRLSWLKEECKSLEDNTQFYATEEELLRKFVTQLETEQLIHSCLKIIRMREKIAKKLDVSRNHILHDQDIITVLKFSGVPKKSKLSKTEIDEALATPETSEDKQIVEKVIKLSKLRKGEKVEKFMLIRKKLHEVAEAEKISPSLIATSDEIVKFANGIKKNIRFLSGWRKEVFGQAALQLMDRDL